MTPRSNRFIRGSVLTFGALLVSFGFALVTSVIIARVLGTEGKGAYSVALRVAGVVAALAQWGIPEVLLNYVNRPEHQLRTLAGTTQAIAVLSGMAALVILPSLYPAVADNALRGVELPLIAVAVASTAFSLSFQFSSRILQLSGDLAAYNALVVLRAGALLALTLVVVFAAEPIQTALIAYLAAELLAAMVSFSLLVRHAGGTPRLDPRLGVALARAGNPVQLGMIAAFLAAEIGVFIVNGMLDLEAVGWYTTGLGLARWVLFVSMATRVVLQTEMAQLGGQGAHVAETTALVCRHSLLWLGAAACGLAVVGYPAILLLYGEAFVPSFEPLLLALPGVVGYGLTQLLSGYFIVVQKSGTPSIVAWFNLLASSGLQLTLIPIFGIAGASAGLSVAYVLGTLLIAWLYRRDAGPEGGRLLPGRSEVAWYRLRIASLARRARPAEGM